MKLFTLCFFILIVAGASAQIEQTSDSIHVLENVIINAFESHTQLINTAASISAVSKRDLDRYDNASLLQAINAKPGVRMDERSPGSYRLNIRGSSLRSPFGVSNVKVYYDGIPFTGPGGSTDLNMLGFYNVQSIEVVKGPAGSMYGAGTGGALLIESEAAVFRPGFSAGYTFGSFNTHNANASVRFGSPSSNSTVGYQHISSDGYRDHTNMRRDVVTWNAALKEADKTQLRAHFLYSNLYYQTPGALTRAEYDVNPRAARPKAGAFPSAEQSKAAIYDQAFLAGFSLKQEINPLWQNATSVYGYYFRHNNPTFRNYTRRVEPNFGGRTNFRYRQNIKNTVLTINFGGEFQKSFITSRLYNNVNGEPGAMQTDDEVNYALGFAFAQAKIETASGWIFTAGGSLNKSQVQFIRLITTPSEKVKRSFKNEFAPRLTVLKKLAPSIALYTSMERGFSSPASSELLPTSGVFNSSLQAENGINNELGVKGNLISNRLFFDVSAFNYRLKNAIVQRQDASGGIFYDNAGSAKQRGIETYLSYAFLNAPYQFFNYGFASISHTWNHFRYDDYKQLADDFSGNRITGVAPHTLAINVDVGTRPGLYGNFSWFYSARIPLNDANTAYADPYHLLGFRLGYKTEPGSKGRFEIFCGVQNLLDETYSLGNDINAAGGRYYNVAAGRSFYAGLKVDWERRKK